MNEQNNAERNHLSLECVTDTASLGRKCMKVLTLQCHGKATSQKYLNVIDVVS